MINLAFWQMCFGKRLKGQIVIRNKIRHWCCRTRTTFGHWLQFEFSVSSLLSHVSEVSYPYLYLPSLFLLIPTHIFIYTTYFICFLITSIYLFFDSSLLHRFLHHFISALSSWPSRYNFFSWFIHSKPSEIIFYYFLGYVCYLDTYSIIFISNSIRPSHTTHPLFLFLRLPFLLSYFYLMPNTLIHTSLLASQQFLFHL